MNPVSLLSEIVAHGGKVNSDFCDSDAFETLVRQKLLREAGVVGAVVCEGCDTPHSAPVVYEGEKYGFYCPDLGFAALEPATITAYAPNLPELVQLLAEAFECRQRKTSIISGQTWRIGRVETAQASVMLYLHPALQSEDDVRDLLSALGREPRSDWRLVVTAAGGLPVKGLVSVPLDELVEIDTETGDLRIIADPGTLAGVPRKNLGGRPSESGPLFVRILEERIASGEALEGRNKEAEAAMEVFAKRHPKHEALSRSRAREYVTKVRNGR